MKRLKKHVVIGTTAGLTGLFLTACGAYGPPIYESVGNTEGASMEISTSQDNTTNIAPEEASTSTSSASISSATTDSAATDSAASATSTAESSDAATGKISFSKVGTVTGDDAISALNSASVDLGDLEYINPKDIPVPTVYGPPVESR